MVDRRQACFAFLQVHVNQIILSNPLTSPCLPPPPFLHFLSSYQNWKRRWVVLKGNSVFYYRTSKPKLLGTVPLDSHSVCSVLTGEHTPVGVPAGCFAFVIKTTHRNLYVYTDRPGLREEWEVAVGEQVKKLVIEQETLAASEEVATEQAQKAQDIEFPPPPLPPPPAEPSAKAPNAGGEEKNGAAGAVESDMSEERSSVTSLPAPDKPLPTPPTASVDNARAVNRGVFSAARGAATLTEERKTSSLDRVTPRSRKRHSKLVRSESVGSSSVRLGGDLRAGSGHGIRHRSHWELSGADIQLGPELGKGAFGMVYQGTLWGTDVAIKKLYSDALAAGNEQEKMKELLSDLRNEVRILSQLRHPNVVLYMGVCTEVPNVCIVTELCPRRSLFEVIHDPSLALSCELRLRMALQAAQGMAYLHNQPARIIHRDLKSHNLLVGENFEIKVADFGLTIVRTQQQIRARDSGRLVDIGGHYGIHGTPQWMAPEVMEGSPYNGKVDVYSYGIVLSEIFARVLPFSDRYRAFEFIDAVLEQGATPTIPRWCFSGRRHGRSPTKAGGPHKTIDWTSQAFGWLEAGGGDSDDEDDGEGQQLDLPVEIQKLRRGTLRRVILQCLDRDPRQRPTFDTLVAALRRVLMPPAPPEAADADAAEGKAGADGVGGGGGGGDARDNDQHNKESSPDRWGFGARVFLEFDLPRLVESLRDAALQMADHAGSGMGSYSAQAVFSSRLLHGAAACREIDDLFSAMVQSRRGLPSCSDDHRYMYLQPASFPLSHPMAQQVVCLLASHLVNLLDAVTGWVSQHGAIAASYEPVSVLWDVLGALEALVRMQDPAVNRAYTRSLHQSRRLRRKRRGVAGGEGQIRTAGVLDVLRDAGLVASIIALFVLLPGDVDDGDIDDGDSDDKEDETDEDEDLDLLSDDAMLRNQLSRCADVGKFSCCMRGFSAVDL